MEMLIQNKFVQLQLLKLILLFLVLSFCFQLILFSQSTKPKILGIESTIQTQVYGCQLKLRIKPEQREPDSWQTQLDISIFSSVDKNQVSTFSSTSDSQGDLEINLCEEIIPASYLTPENYDFLVKGQSHLSKVFPNIYGFERVYTFLDLSNDSNFLIAGDINLIPDDEINSLDATFIIKNLGAEQAVDPEYNELHDLNYDGIVNQDDIYILINNFYEIGQQIN